MVKTVLIFTFLKMYSFCSDNGIFRSESPFNHGVHWMTNKKQWLLELSSLLEKDREKSKSKEKSVRLYFGENRPKFKHGNKTFIAERRSIDLTKEEGQCEPEIIGNDDTTAKTSYEGFYQDNHELTTIPAKDLIMLTSKFKVLISAPRNPFLRIEFLKSSRNSRISCL